MLVSLDLMLELVELVLTPVGFVTLLLGRIGRSHIYYLFLEQLVFVLESFLLLQDAPLLLQIRKNL
jgi:hypothetical protein